MPTLSPRLFWLLPLCALALLLAWRPQAKAPASDYITASAETRDLEQLIMADGTLKARKQVSVGAQVSGQIKKLHVTLGQEVKQGELLVEIDDLPQQNAPQGCPGPARQPPGPAGFQRGHPSQCPPGIPAPAADRRKRSWQHGRP